MQNTLYSVYLSCNYIVLYSTGEPAVSDRLQEESAHAATTALCVFASAAVVVVVILCFLYRKYRCRVRGQWHKLHQGVQTDKFRLFLSVNGWIWMYKLFMKASPHHRWLCSWTVLLSSFFLSSVSFLVFEKILSCVYADWATFTWGFYVINRALHDFQSCHIVKRGKWWWASIDVDVALRSKNSMLVFYLTFCL